MMLTLIGLGLYNEQDLTLRGLDIARKADSLYMELYTSKWFGNLKNLENIIGKRIKILRRDDLEEKSKNIVEEAIEKNIVIFVLGDPLIATTHSSLILDARKLGIPTNVIHNASIMSAIGETGLHMYKFGPTITIPFPEKTKGKLPESVYETIKMNRSRGLHTLCLLDVIAEDEKYMTPNEAMEILLNVEDKRKESVFNQETEIVVFVKAGGNSSIVFGKVKDLLNKSYETPAVLIIPGILHFTEREFLEK